MAVVGAIEGFRIFTDQRAFNFKNLLVTPKLFSVSPNTFGLTSLTGVGAAAVAQKSATTCEMESQPLVYSLTS